MKKYLVLFTSIAALMSAPASAADMPLKAPPPPPVFSWTGPYIGANGGYGWAEDTWIFPPGGQLFSFTALGNGFATKPKGGLVGGEIGYYIGMNGTPIVFGFEIAGDYADIKETVTSPFPVTNLGDSFRTRLRDLETYMAKLGLAWNNWLWYIEAGAGSGQVEFNGIAGPAVLGGALAGSTFSATERLGGIAVGAGVETVWGNHFLLGAEYKYVDLGTFGMHSIPVLFTGGLGPLPFGVTFTDNSNGFHVQTVTGRVGYKF